MSTRAVILGLLLGLFVSAFTYFNDAVIRQTFLIGNLFPVGVFGVIVLLLLVVNPLLRRRALRGSEIAVVTAIGLAACGWPGGNYFRLFTGIVARPGQLIRDQPTWQAAYVRAYLPGNAAEIGEAHVEDWPGLAQKLTLGARDDGPAALRQLWAMLPNDAQGIALSAAERGRLERYEIQRLLAVLNDALILRSELYANPAFAGLDLGPQGQALRERQKRLQEARQRELAAIGPLQEEGERQRSLSAPRRSALEADLSNLQGEAQAATQRLAALRTQRDQLGSQIEQTQTEVFRLEREQAAPSQAIASEQSPALKAAIQRLEELQERNAAAAAEHAQADERLEELNDQLLIVGQLLARVDRPAFRLEDHARLKGLWAEYYDFELGRLRRAGNRLVLMALFPQHIKPSPAGSGWILNAAEADPFAVNVLGGWNGRTMLWPTDLPWSIWWPTLRLWGGLALLLGLSAVFLVLIVHPQWSRRELLPYPIARFVQEISQRQPGQWLPEIAHSKLFWLSLLIVLGIHNVNGIHAWFKGFIQIPLAFTDFVALMKLAEDASRAPMAWAIYQPQIFFSVIGFAFFLRTEMSLSLGVIGAFYLALASIVYSYGVPLQNVTYRPENFTMILFGAWLGGFLIILYIGRRYYSLVLTGAMGLTRRAEVPPYALWAARGLVLTVLGAIWLLSAHGLDWLLSLLVVALILMLFVVVTRINAETGAFFIQAGWMPVAVFTAVFGDQALGPTAYLLLALVSVVMVADPREALMPFLANGLQMTDQSDVPPRKTGPWLAVMVVAGFVVALGVTFLIQYNRGLNLNDKWAVTDVPSAAFDHASRVISDLGARGALSESNAPRGLARLAAIRPDGQAMAWLGLGFVLVVLTAVARLRLSWWPLHPVMFMVFGTMTSMRFATSFLIGWAIKAAVVRLGGSKSYRAVRPLMVGMIAGEILAALVWIVVGAIYYWNTGLEPKQYAVYPG